MRLKFFITLFILGLGAGCKATSELRPIYYIGIDVSPSFRKSPDFQNSLRFLSHFLSEKLQASSSQQPFDTFILTMEDPDPLGVKKFLSKSDFPDSSPDKILESLQSFAHPIQQTQITVFNTPLKEIREHYRNHKLALHPIRILLVTDGQTQIPGTRHPSRELNFKRFENSAPSYSLAALFVQSKNLKFWSQSKIQSTFQPLLLTSQQMRSWSPSTPNTPHWLQMKLNSQFEK